MGKADCTVRALSIVTGASYAAVVDRLSQDGYRPGRGFHLDRWLTCIQSPVIGEPELPFGWRAVWVSVPRAKRGESQPRMAEFLVAHPRGRYIVRQARHVVAVVDGRPMMEQRHDSAMVYGAWEFQQ